MSELVALPIEVQIVLVAGYLGYKIAVIGRGYDERWDEVVLKVLAFGLVARASVLLISLAISADSVQRNASTDELAVAFAIGSTLLTGILAGYLWRRWIEKPVSKLMGILGVYSDDHERSTLRTITNSRAEWHSVSIHLRDGRVLESDFGAVPKPAPTNPIVLNDDAVAIYITRTYPVEGEPTEYLTQEDKGSVLSYIPRTEITQIDIAWQHK